MDLEFYKIKLYKSRKTQKISGKSQEKTAEKFRLCSAGSTHDEVFEEIDCLSCANCCKTTGPLFTEKDIEKNC